MNNEFKNLGLSENVLKSIDKLKYTTPSKIQKEMIPIILNGDDCVGQAQTGTGKTLAFASAILSKLSKEGNNVKAVVITPTRELALQISKEFNSLDQNHNFSTLAVYGGDSITRQIKLLKNKVDIVVGTPGRVKDLIQRRKLNLTTIDFFVLDEADEMLNMGFLEDIESIIKSTARDKQVLMLSATMSREIKELTKNYMKQDSKFIKIESQTKTNENIEQSYYLVNDKQRTDVLYKILDYKDVNRTIIFGRTKAECDTLSYELKEKGYKAQAMHGDISQSIRIKTLDMFRKNKFSILVATDVAARGIHINDVDMIINYKLPQDNESYIHRIGRTGRAGNKGIAITLVNNKETKVIRSIAKYANCKILEQQLPESKEIIKMKYDKIINKTNELVKEGNLNDSLEYVRDLNKNDLMNFAAALLKYSVDKEVKFDTDKDFSVKVRNVSETKKGQTRVFVNVGKMDNLKMGSLLDLIKDTTKMDKSHFNNIEVLQTFSFIDVTDEVVNEFIDKFSGTLVKNRKIRIEISNNKPSGRKERPKRNFNNKRKSYTKRER